MKRVAVVALVLAACGSSAGPGSGSGSGGHAAAAGAGTGSGGHGSGGTTATGGAGIVMGASGGDTGTVFGTGGRVAANGGGAAGRGDGGTGGTGGTGETTGGGGPDGGTGDLPATGGRSPGTAGAGGSGGGSGSPGADAGTPGNFMPCPATGNCKIMPLGDSITAGDRSSDRGGYRTELFRLALMNGKRITLVGRNMGGPTSVTVGGTTTMFPQNNEGYGGYTIETIGNRSGIATPTVVDAALTMFTPHIVLLMIGTNDVNNNLDVTNAPTRLGALLDRITTMVPGALLVVATIVPIGTDATNILVQTYNDAIPTLVQSRAGQGKHIVMVDMYTAMTANPNYKSTLFADNLHPNNAGYAVLAQTWYESIKGDLP